MAERTFQKMPSWLKRAGGWVLVIAIAIGLGIYARAPRPLLPSGQDPGPLFPRIPAPPPDLPSLLHQLGVGSVVWYGAIVVLPFLVWSARAVEPERRGRLRTVAGGVVAIALLALGTAVAEYLITYGSSSLGPGIGSYLAVALERHVLPWTAIVGLVAVYEGRRRARESLLERERLRAEVAEQRLIALTGQLQPHFLFNTLQGISTLIHRDPEAADEMLAKLSDLLAELLKRRDRALVPLGDEVSYVRTYLEIAQLRFGDRLAVAIDVPDALLGNEVPVFILQPLVENALRHGVGARVRGGRIAVTGRKEGDRLVLEVTDDGPGLGDGARAPERVGLTNTRDRLRATFGVDQSLTLSPGASGGTVARIEMPARWSRVTP